MILRLLALIGVIFLMLKAGRLFFSALQSNQPIAGGDQEPSRIDDVMVKDPYCQVFFPKRDGLHVQVSGQDLFFCSADCRDKFLAEQK